MIFLASSLFPINASYAKKDSPKQPVAQQVVLTPADRLILEAINRTNERIDSLSKDLNTSIDNLSKELNTRIDSLAKDFDTRIDSLSKDLNTRIDSLSKDLNTRIDNLWITMLGGFLGVMAFIGGIVFWDRRTFLKRIREECRDEMSSDRKKLEVMLGAMKKLSEQFPEVREVLAKSGLL
jgi:hypothetical protein